MLLFPNFLFGKQTGKGRVTRPHSTKQDRYAGYSGSLPSRQACISHRRGLPYQADTAQALGKRRLVIRPGLPAPTDPGRGTTPPRRLCPLFFPIITAPTPPVASLPLSLSSLLSQDPCRVRAATSSRLPNTGRARRAALAKALPSWSWFVGLLWCENPSSKGRPGSPARSLLWEQQNAGDGSCILR